MAGDPVTREGAVAWYWERRNHRGQVPWSPNVTLWKPKAGDNVRNVQPLALSTPQPAASAGVIEVRTVRMTNDQWQLLGEILGDAISVADEVGNPAGKRVSAACRIMQAALAAQPQPQGEVWRLYRDCKPTGLYETCAKGDWLTGTLVGCYASDEAAMTAAQDAGLLREAGEDEGGPPFAVLAAPHYLMDPDEAREVFATLAQPAAAPVGEAERRDAARYRHLRGAGVDGQAGFPVIAVPSSPTAGHYVNLEDADAAVDRGMAALATRPDGGENSHG